MGRGPDAVVDASLRVHGITNLRIADNSIMPRIPVGHTMAATMAIAEKAADLIAAAASR
jgi:choline dehydrogenase